MKETVSELYDKWILELDEKYDELSNAKTKEFCSRYKISDLFFSNYHYDEVFVQPPEDDKKALPMLPLKHDKKALPIPPLEGYKKGLCTNHANKRRKTKRREAIKNLDSKQTIIQTSSIYRK